MLLVDVMVDAIGSIRGGKRDDTIGVGEALDTARFFVNGSIHSLFWVVPGGLLYPNEVESLPGLSRFVRVDFNNNPLFFASGVALDMSDSPDTMLGVIVTTAVKLFLGEEQTSEPIFIFLSRLMAPFTRRSKT